MTVLGDVDIEIVGSGWFGIGGIPAGAGYDLYVKVEERPEVFAEVDGAIDIAGGSAAPDMSGMLTMVMPLLMLGMIMPMVGGEESGAGILGLGDYMKQGGPVSRNGTSILFGINRHRAWQIVRDCARRAGLPKLVNPDTGRVHNVSPHRFRDAFAVHAVKLDDSGDGLRMLQQHLGHQSITTTMRYRKVAGEEHKEWYERLWR